MSHQQTVIIHASLLATVGRSNTTRRRLTTFSSFPRKKEHVSLEHHTQKSCVQLHLSLSLSHPMNVNLQPQHPVSGVKTTPILVQDAAGLTHCTSHPISESVAMHRVPHPVVCPLRPLRSILCPAVLLSHRPWRGSAATALVPAEQGAPVQPLVRARCRRPDQPRLACFPLSVRRPTAA